MGKRLGYTFYPKDWRANMKVQQLSLKEKGFYRELIDECYLQNSNIITINCKSFTRLHQLNVRSLATLISKLHECLLIVCPNFDQTLAEVEILIPSVSGRLGVIKSASNGGKVSSRKGVKNVTKSKENIKEKKKENIYRSFSHLELTKEEFKRLEEEYTKLEIDSILDDIENYKGNKNYTSLNLTARKWLRKRKEETKTKGEKWIAN